jgi:undecaprenyl-diphosphatase
MKNGVVFFVTAVVAFAAFLLLGALVSHADPSAFDRSMLGLYGHGVPLATVLTTIGRFPTYFALCLFSVIVVAFRREWLSRVLLAIVGLVVVWQTSDVFKVLFHRPRPLHPLLAETSFGYPSGHADLSLFFYGLWAYYIWKAPIPRPIRIAWVTLSALLVAAIGWSRLALGAHFPTDVLGGYLYGGAFLALAAGLRLRVFSDRPGPRASRGVD